MALPLEKWKEVLGFYLYFKSINIETLSFLREMTFQCEDGWPTQPTLVQSQWALSIIDSYDTWYERRIKSEKVSFIEQIVKKWKRYTKPVKSKKGKASAKEE